MQYTMRHKPKGPESNRRNAGNACIALYLRIRVGCGQGKRGTMKSAHLLDMYGLRVKNVQNKEIC